MIWVPIGWGIVLTALVVMVVMLMGNILKNIEKTTKDINETIEMMSDERSTAEGPGAG